MSKIEKLKTLILEREQQNNKDYMNLHDKYVSLKKEFIIDLYNIREFIEKTNISDENYKKFRYFLVSIEHKYNK
jgi:hypothetical protein